MAVTGLFWSLKICFVYVSSALVVSINAKNTLAPNQIFKNEETLISANNRFELGFFNVSSSRDPNQELRYLGIWYRGITPLTVVWVANRINPLRGIRVKLYMTSGGNLFIGDNERNMIHLSTLDEPIAKPSLVLLDTGNLVVKYSTNDSNERYAWQSFDFPTDTLLPGMKLGLNSKPGADRVLTSWRTSEDPWVGEFVLRIESYESPQLLLQKNGKTKSRWGPWNGKIFSGSKINDNPVFRTVYHFSPEEVYFMFEMLDQSVLLRLAMNSVGEIQFLKWKSSSRSWVSMVTLNKDICDRYGTPGPYGICYANDPGCHCLEGFLANSLDDWIRLDCTDGCRRKTALNCSNGDGFVRYTGIKLPDNFTVWRGLSSQECADSCSKNCTCMAYTNIDMYGNGSHCVVWLDNLVDIRDSTPDGDELYIRMARVEIESISHSKKKKKEKNIITISSLMLAAFLGAAFWCYKNQCRCLTCWTANRANRQEDGVDTRESVAVQNDDMFADGYIQLFSMSTISVATNNFSPANKIGQGGFGPVYEGELQNGEKIAVKRLSEHSNQGLHEFKNEVLMIEQLQHRNLVKLLGCCIHGDERMLIYEYMANKSLDQIIFDPSRKSLLPWEKRISILKGIAKGLDYLHFGSRTKVVHRDLKASNILLDEGMTPRISDFGLARNSENETEETTKRVIGTHGYMSPEYVIDGYYSPKSDVFSFGVLVLEMISGQRNWGFHHPEHDFNLLGHAWKLWKESRDSEFIDPVLQESIVETEVSRCIQVGLLCVQHSSDQRPIMSEVISMLENENIKLPEPQEPGFFNLRSAAGRIGASFAWNWNQYSVNGLTVTDLTGRA